MSSSTLSNTNNTLAPLGAYLNDQPDRSNATNETNFQTQYSNFASLMGTRPQFFDAFTDFTQSPSQWGSSASFAATSFAGSGNSFLAPGSGTIPVVGVPMATNAFGPFKQDPDSFYQQIISGSLDADYTGIVDGWANAGFKTAEFRIGYEFNGFMPWTPASNGSDNADFVAAWQHIASLIHAEGTKDGITAKTTWDPATTNGSSYDVQTLYPGDQYVDVVSVDVYGGGTPNNLVDFATGGTTVDATYAVWVAKPANIEHYYLYENFTLGNPTPALGATTASGYGWSFADTVAFAKEHNKPFGIDETGATSGQDDAVFPTWLASTIAGVEAEGVTVDHVDIWSNGTATFDFVNGSRPNEAAAWAAGFGANSADIPCFLPGTLIRTPCGETPVERLEVGDAIVTASGTLKRLIWIGVGRSLVTRGRRSAATPVIVRKGALADNVPYCDLRITKGHSLYLGGVMIPAEFLVNHRSILWDDAAQEVTVFHLELEQHDVLLANGAPAETYRDDGNRWLFRNANAGWHLPAKPPCAAVLTGGPIVDDVWHRLLQRSGARPGLPLTKDPDVHLMIDGRRIDAATRRGEARIFRLPRCPGSVRIVSREGVPAEAGQARDPRSLGVALRRIELRRGAKLVLIEADDDRLVDGWHGYEPDDRLRWTNGDAELPAALFSGFSGDMELLLHLCGSMSYPLHVERAEQRVA